MSGRRIRVLLVDDHPSSREPLAELLDREHDLTVAGQAGTLAEARALLSKNLAVDVALVDLELPDGHGAELVRDLRAHRPHAFVLVLTGILDRREHGRAVAAGAGAVLHKSATTRQVVETIRRLDAGEAMLTKREIAEHVHLAAGWTEQTDAERRALARLTPREREILKLLAEGLGDRAIGERLFISEKTVRNHMVEVLAKLGVDSRLQALILAVRHGYAAPS